MTTGAEIYLQAKEHQGSPITTTVQKGLLLQSLIVCKLVPVWGGGQRPKKKTDHSRWVGGRVNKQRNLQGLSLAPESRSLHGPARILEVYIQALTGFNDIDHPHGLNNTSLSQGWIHATASSGHNIYSKDRRGCKERPIAQCQLLGEPAGTSSQ